MVNRPMLWSAQDEDDPRNRTNRVQGNTRGPRPGSGNNQGTGTADRADRTQQGRNANPMLSSGGGTTPGENPKKPVVNTPQRGSIDDGQEMKPSTPTGVKSAAQRVAEINQMLNGMPPDDPARYNLERERALLSGFEAGGRSSGSSSDSSSSGSQAGPTTPTGNVQRTTNPNLQEIFDTSLDRLIAEDITNLVGGDVQPIINRHVNPDGSLASIEELLSGNQFVLDSGGNQIVRDPATGMVGYYTDVLVPEEAQDENGNWYTTGRMIPDPTGATRFVPTQDELALRAFSELETKLEVMRAEQDFVRDELAADSEAERENNRMILESRLAMIRDQANLAATQRFQAGENDLAFERETYLTNLNNQANKTLQELQNTWQATQNGLDRSISTYQFHADLALREGEFELARQRFGFERALSTAGFMLQAMSFVTENPQMLVLMREAGVFENLSAMTGVDFSFLAGLGELEGQSALEEAELPPLREWQQMPPDEQQSVLFNLSMTLGVKRELIVQEIERRSRGFGLAGASSGPMRRIPVGV